MTAKVLIMNGPNFNLLGLRQPEIYGRETLADLEAMAVSVGTDLDLAVTCLQSNAEHVLIDAIHAARNDFDAIIINPAAFSHTSIAILDALKAFDGPVIEVHLSNIHQREAFRHHSYISLRANGVIAGCGTQGYELALQRIARMLAG